MNKRIPLKRRIKKKTDYSQRLGLLKSGKPRLVVRKSQKNFTVQIADYDHELGSDYIYCGCNSKNLSQYGWKAATGNTPASYLTGYECGLKALSKGIEEAVPDIGINRISKGSNIFAAIKGARDAGLDVPLEQEIVPSEERIKGKHIADYADEGNFTKYEEKGLDPAELPSHFETVKQNIEKEIGD
ncbi:50S ribosomal protein L18 [Methanonatronarchaeum sp. AMET6-2]|uniref:50S ribosomal protein L18 n=1 Tax=Methanonatronarchaeum sp. AMET6-2 TaxID=2933293 RepID=UPI001216FF2A|nr:50S ribosomal protein L18 [Methanonatronarchaeum sp. AMET6-2]RZN60226.1 MAG: 50S ribosomal protein L18 [Methanonatronarchaeia archaeon]UOY10720.1 50S ribosomal protein L18 [Methanonatronarchaeum sp. AMET6-2]